MSGWWGESRMQFPKIDQMAREYAKYASEREEQSPEIS